MLPTETNINTVPIYDSIDYLYRNKRYASGTHVILQSALNIPRFQLLVDDEGLSPDTIDCKIYDINDTLITTIENPNVGARYFVKRDTQMPTGKELICSIGTNLPQALDENYYRFEIVYGTQTYYSEYYYACQDLTDAVRLTYYSSQDISLGDYFIYAKYGQDTENVNVFNAYFETDLGKPQYPQENIINSNLGVDVPLHMISKKQFRFFIKVIESQMDAIRVASVSDYIQIGVGTESYNVANIEFGEIEWGDNGVGDCEVIFSVGSVMANKALATSSRGSFNNDFNNDLK